MSPHTLPDVSTGLELGSHAPGAQRALHRSPRAIRTRAASALFALASALSLGGCPGTGFPPNRDAGDGGDPRRIDTDGDGLCDEQELSRGLAWNDPDTDDDGYSDFVELSLGFDPFSRTSPDPTRLVFLREAAEATARAVLDVEVDGEGESYSGSFTPAPVAFPEPANADDYFAGASPVGAEPMGNVFSIDEPGQSFVGVVGRTLLTYEVRFRFEGEGRGCMRAHPFVYTVKHEDGTIVSATRFALVVVPPGAQPGIGEWCAPALCF